MPNMPSADELKSLGLNAREISIHQRRIVQNLKQPVQRYLPIQDTCRLDNFGILPSRFLANDAEAPAPEGFAAFVPAAGAASRYFAPLQDLRRVLVEGTATELESELGKLRQAGAADWPLPPALLKLVQGAAESSLKQTALDEIDACKALLPSSPAGPSFLRKKLEEHKQLPGLDAEVYVAPIGQSENFSASLGQAYNPEKCLFLEQGTALSTLRFQRDGSPYREESGELSIVPAGHGMLVKLFPEIRKRLPKVHSLFIRNIDNVITEADEALAFEDTAHFLSQYQRVLASLKAIRSQLKSGQTASAEREARTLRESLSTEVQTASDLAGTSQDTQNLWTILLSFFHCPPTLASAKIAELGEAKALIALYSRPLNVLGQVPNSGKDVGGSPVLALQDGEPVTICLELPHASPEDRKAHLENPKRATHFNPVFVAAELPEDIEVYGLDQCPFWILAEKTIHGVPVVYHEIVLYELLGNSFSANVLFPEIPRRLFHPHKSLLDGLKK